MRALKIIPALAAALALASCVTTVETGPKPPKTVNADAWSVSGLPRVTNRYEFEILLHRAKAGGTREQRCTFFVAMQLYMDLCLPFIIEHIEDTGPFENVAYPIVSRAGIKLGNGLQAKGLGMGAALELFLISYFFKDPARRNVPEQREGAIDLWNAWHAQRKDSLRWNSRGHYSNR